MRNKEYSMLIKYKTEPTIIVLSPNSANLIKILTQFVYSINIRYFSPPPPLYFAIQNTGEEFKSEPIPQSWISSTQPEMRHFIVSTGLLDSSPLY